MTALGSSASTVGLVRASAGRSPAGAPSVRAAVGGLATGRLPVPLSSLVGRQRDIAELTGLLATDRLVTLTGPGGAGKTRLAAALATSRRADQPGGVWWLSLAPMAESEQLTDALAEALGVRVGAGSDATDAIARRLAADEALVVLDNCEHVIDAAARLALWLLTECVNLRILATSREMLALPGERIWPVPALTFPARDVEPELGRAADYGAVDLFRQRASAADPGFRLDVDTLPAVTAICRRLEGIPLAIELAAARVRVLGVEQVASALDQEFGLLAAPAVRGSPARHQTLQATLDWSHDLLSTAEQRVFRRLSVFPGGFDLAAATAVAAAAPAGTEPASVLDLLTRLVDKSLVQVTHHGGVARYRMLATVRAYGRRRLVGTERQAVGRAHLEHFLQVAQRAEPLVVGGDAAVQLDRLELEGNNFRAALAFARAEGRPQAGLRLACALWPLCYLRGHYREGRRWLDWAADNADDAPANLCARALHGSGMLAFLQCDYAVAVRRLTESLRLYRRTNNPLAVAEVMLTLGSVAREQGRYTDADRLYTRSRVLSQRHRNARGTARANNYLGFVAWLRADYDTAASLCATTLGLFTELDDTEGIAWSLLSQGVVAQYQGDLARARDLLDDSLARSRAAGYREGVAWSLHELGLVALRQGDLPTSAQLLRQALAAHRDLGDRWRTASVLDDLAGLAAAQAAGGRIGDDGDSGDEGEGGDEAARLGAWLVGAAERVRAEIGSLRAPCEQPDHEQTMQVLRSALGGDGLAAEITRGRNSRLDDLLSPLVSASTTAAGSSRPALPAPRRPDHRQPDPAGAALAPATAAAVGLRVQLLGNPAVHRDGRLLDAADWTYAKPRELLYLLASSEPQRKEQLGLALWPELDDHALRNALHTALRDLRRTLGSPEWITYQHGRYQMGDAGPLRCDVIEFEVALAAARRASGSEAGPGLRQAVQLYRGEFLAGVHVGEWADERRRALRVAYQDALVAYGRTLDVADDLDRAVAILQRAVEHDPLDERAHRGFMLCVARAGEPARAVRDYQELAQRLRAELGIAPADRTTAVFRRIAHPSSA